MNVSSTSSQTTSTADVIASASGTSSVAQLEKQLRSVQQQIQKEIALADIELGDRQRALAAIREELQPVVTASGLVPTNRPAPSARLQAVAELRRAQVETSLQKQTLLRRLADMVVSERSLWQMRFASFDTRDLAKIREGYQRLDHLERMMRIVRPYFLQQLDLAATLIAEQRNRTDVLPDTAGEMRDCLQEREVLAQRGLRALDNLDRLVARWQESLDQERSHLPVITRVRDLFSEASSFTTKFWHFELFAATDSITVDGQIITGRRSVTVGKIALALIILTMGYWLSLLLSRLLERLAIKRFKIESSQAGLMRRWMQVVLILALGIGANIAVFSVVNTLMLRPLPFPNAQELVWIAPPPTKCGLSCATYSTDAYDEFRMGSRSYQDVTGYFAFSLPGNVNLRIGNGVPVPATSIDVIANFFQVLGVQPAMGRLFRPEDGRNGAAPVVVLSDAWWRRQFAADPKIVGKAFDMNGQQVTVIGVLPKSFDFGAVFSPGANVDALTPLNLYGPPRDWGNIITLIGRMKPGVSLSQARQEAAAARQFG